MAAAVKVKVMTDGATFAKALARGGAGRKNNPLDNKFMGTYWDKYFKVTERGSNLTTEIRAGITTYLTSCYIMAVNPNILSVTGLNFDGLVFATAMSSCIATLIMAFWANLPFGVFPGMGTNAYFAYTVVGFKGTSVPVKPVMFAVFIEGLIFLVISLTDMRRQIFKIFPKWLMKASMAGIGLFLAHIGLQAGNGIIFTRDNPAVLVDLAPLNGEHAGVTWIGLFFFLVMSTLVMLKVKGAIMIGILLSTFTCWILAAVGTPSFTYQQVCCLGEVQYPKTFNADFYPTPGGGTGRTEVGMPKPTCMNAFDVVGKSGTKLIKGVAGVGTGDDYYTSTWVGSSVVMNSFGNWTITAPDGTVHTHMGSLSFKGNGDGRNGLGNVAGGCTETCHLMHGGFNPACFGVIMTSTTCWSGMSYVEPDRTITNAMGATFSSPEFGGSPPLTPYTKIDGFGEGCLGGAGRIPKTFTSPIEFFSPPKGAMAKEGPVAPWFGAFGCGDAGSKCWAGDIPGGTFVAWAYNDLTFNNFGAPLLVLLYIDFIGTMAFLYSAADLCGLMNEKGDNFPGCYGAFMADGIGTMVGGLLGTSSLTTYGESMTGVYEGGRTGLTALTIAFFNFLSIFLAPFFASIPTVATGPALILVGVFMIEGVKDVDWMDYMQSIPAMLTILVQPVTYRIEIGIIAGLFTWIFMMVFSLRITLWMPRVWKCMPKVMQKFVADQYLQPYEKEQLADLGYTSDGGSSTKEGAETTSSA